MLTELEEALERLQAFDLERRDGFTHQGPMAVEALSALGHPSLIPAFADVYVPRLQPLPHGHPIAVGERGRALGDRARRADWVATYDAEIVADGVGPVVERALPVLLPGAFAAAGFGAVRTSHALRALSESDDRLRRRELAFGLAHWASRYQVLPGDPGVRPETGRTCVEVIGRSRVAASDRRRIGRMSDAVLVLEGDAVFAGELAAVDLGAESPHDALRTMVRAAARLYLGHPESRVVYGQCIRVLVALDGLLEVMSSSLHAQAVGRGLQILLALHSVYGIETETEGRGIDFPDDPECDELADHPDEIRYRAACSGEENAIGVAEACIRAHSFVPDEVFLRAAADAALRFDPGRAGRGG